MKKIFISYSHQDEALKDLLVKHLKVLETDGNITVWDDQKIRPGQDWETEIEKSLNEASIAILMISADFLISGFITEQEIPRILERRQKEGLTVIPCIVRPCAWQTVSWLSHIQVYTPNGKPISEGSKAEKDSKLAALAEMIQNIAIQDDRLKIKNRQKQIPITGAFKNQNPGTIDKHNKWILFITFFILLAASLSLLFFGKNQWQMQAAFALLALVASIVTYGFLSSSGKIKTKKTQISGAAAVFIIIYYALTMGFKSKDDIRGIIYLDNIPPKNATVFLLETELLDNRRFIEERDKGYFVFKNIPNIGDEVRFSIIIPPLKEKVVICHYKPDEIIKIYFSTDKRDPTRSVVDAPPLPSSDNDNTEMIFIPSCEFTMGSNEKEIDRLISNNPDWKHEWFDDEKPQRKVYLDDFFISKYEVTNVEYSQFLKDNPNYEKPIYWNVTDFNRPNQPVVGVSWHDAVAYCKWLSNKTKQKYRLPTEAEWEKAARGTDARIYPWGDSLPDINKANFMQQFNKPSMSDDMSQGASVYGVMNMAGNVYEWCNDWYNESDYNKDDNRNPTGISDGTMKVVRGGSWKENAFFLRCADRNCYPPQTKNEYIGFRIVRVPKK